MLSPISETGIAVSRRQTIGCAAVPQIPMRLPPPARLANVIATDQTAALRAHMIRRRSRTLQYHLFSPHIANVGNVLQEPGNVPSVYQR
jgi:hypothetical protein